MASAEQVGALLVELGPILDLGAVYAEGTEHGWSLATLDNKSIVFVDFAPDDDRLWLSAEVGTPRPEDRVHLYPLVLQYNVQWQETGGLRLGLDGPEGAIVLACDIAASGLDVSRLGSIVTNFLEILEGWRQVVAGTVETPETPDAMLHPSSGFIRG